MRTSVSVAIVVSLVLVVTSLWLQVDQDLLPEVAAILADVNERQKNDSEAYLFLTGIGAAENEDVIAVGKEVLQELKTLESAYFNSLDVSGPTPDVRPTQLAVPEKSEVFHCSFDEEDCFVGIAAYKDRANDELQKWSQIYERYLSFIQYQEFNTLTKPSMNETWPEYRYLTAGNQLRILELVAKASSGLPQEAWRELTADITKLRTQLRVGDTVLHKAVLAKLIANNLDALFFIKAKYLPAQTGSLAPLSDAETSFDLTIARDIHMAYSLFNSMDGHPEFFKKEGKLPAWVVKVSFKPMKSVNQVYQGYAELEELLDLPMEEFAQQAPEFVQDTVPAFDITNFTGNFLASIYVVDLREYKAALYDLNVKIAMFNFALRDVNAKLINPYYPDVPVEVPSSGELCLDRPFPDGSINLCMRVRDRL